MLLASVDVFRQLWEIGVLFLMFISATVSLSCVSSSVYVTLLDIGQQTLSVMFLPVFPFFVQFGQFLGSASSFLTPCSLQFAIKQILGIFHLNITVFYNVSLNPHVAVCGEVLPGPDSGLDREAKGGGVGQTLGLSRMTAGAWPPVKATSGSMRGLESPEKNRAHLRADTQPVSCSPGPLEWPIYTPFPILSLRIRSPRQTSLLPGGPGTAPAHPP